MMSTRSAMTMLAAAGLVGATSLCPLCDRGVPTVQAQASRTEPSGDTAVVWLRISGMTCGTCPATARLALRRLPGVHNAIVTLDDSLGVVRYDPRRVRPADIAEHLTRLTGYRAAVLPDSAAPRRPDPR